ncbi:Leucine-rich repeat-containing protein [Artemisia annua]|uniref:Leucine-rich repeat-containing protein n=1 Tax=Artemisia annua TaxID=35608 RepID=A0A2U1KNY9_ARTAN|nr:Leucine-rich repeat-containing protein [Artemisia annua]
MFSGNVPFDSFASPSLKVLFLDHNQLGGQIDVQTFPQLTNLTYLDLSFNNFSGELELDTLLSTLTNLEWLDLSYSGFSVTTKNANHYVNPGFRILGLASCKLKVFPNSFRAMKQLYYLDLSSNEIHGQIPHWAGEIGSTYGANYGLRYVNLSHNFITSLPQFQWYGLGSLYLQSNLIEGPFPPSICNMISTLYYLDMSNNRFGGLIPQCFGNISKSLRMIDMGNNSFQGTIPNVYGDCGSLEGLILNGNQLEANSLNGTLPSWLFTSPSLLILNLNDNMFSGNVPFESFTSPSLKYLYLGYNQLGGQIDVQTFPQLTNLIALYLSYNNFSGELELDSLLSTLTNLEGLILSYSGFSVTTNNANHYVNPGFRSLQLASCKLKVFPNSFRAMKQLEVLDLSSNKIHGQIPHWAGEIGSSSIGLEYLNLSHNFITALPQFQWYGLDSLYLQSNLIEGPFPPSICNMSNLNYLDMSNNRFGGSIPQCFGNISSSLYMIDMGNNSFQGTIPNVYGDCGGLEGLILKGNQLEGEIGSSSIGLEYLNLSHNFITGLPQFQWHGLKVLYLQSNLIEGPFPPSICNMSSLYYLDMSNNRFGGLIPQCFGNISSSLTMIDMGNNSFQGTIPNVYGDSGNLEGLILNGNQLEEEHHEEESGFTWEVVTLGFGCGTLLGLVMGSYMLSTRKVKWFNAIADAAESFVLKKRKRRHVYIGK